MANKNLAGAEPNFEGSAVVEIEPQAVDLRTTSDPTYLRAAGVIRYRSPCGDGTESEGEEEINALLAMCGKPSNSPAPPQQTLLNSASRMLSSASKH